MHNQYQSFENPELNKKFYLAIDENNHPNKICLNEFLKEKYPNLYDKINDEKKADDDESFFLFKEIVYEGSLIGYVSYGLLDEFEDGNILVLERYFIFSGYDYSLIIDDLIETGFWLGFQIIIRYPTRRFVEALIESEFAYRIDSKIVFSEIAFMTDTVSLDTATDKLIDEVDQLSNSYSISSIYDLDLCAVVTLTEKTDKIYNNQELDDENIDDYCSISIALREDDDDYSCMKKRRKNKLLKNGKYFANVDEILTKYEQRHK